MPDDESLAVAAQRGCRASFEQLVARLQGPLLHYLRRFAPSREDAEDLVQEAFVRAFENLHRYRTPWRFSTWLFTIARRLQINQHRHRPAPATLADRGLAAASGADDPDRRLMAAERRDQLWQTAERVLSEPQCTALWLYYVEELPLVEIARVLCRTRVGVKALLFRARRLLLPALGALHDEADNAAPRTPVISDGRRGRGTARRIKPIREPDHVASASRG